MSTEFNQNHDNGWNVWKWEWIECRKLRTLSPCCKPIFSAGPPGTVHTRYANSRPSAPVLPPTTRIPKPRAVVAPSYNNSRPENNIKRNRSNQCKNCVATVQYKMVKIVRNDVKEITERWEMNKENWKSSNLMREREKKKCNLQMSLLLCALSVGSRRNVTRRFDARNGPESTSWIMILIASPSNEVCRRGASKSSKAGGWNCIAVNWLVLDVWSAALSRIALISGLMTNEMISRLNYYHNRTTQYTIQQTNKKKEEKKVRVNFNRSNTRIKHGMYSKNQAKNNYCCNHNNNILSMVGQWNTYNCEPRLRIRRSSSTNNAESFFSGLGEFSLYIFGSWAVARNDDRRDAGFALMPAAELNTDGANTSYADALHKMKAQHKHFSSQFNIFYLTFLMKWTFFSFYFVLLLLLLLSLLCGAYACVCVCVWESTFWWNEIIIIWKCMELPSWYCW